MGGSQSSANVLLVSERDPDFGVVKLDLCSSAMDGLSVHEQDGLGNLARRDQRVQLSNPQDDVRNGLGSRRKGAVSP